MKTLANVIGEHVKEQPRTTGRACELLDLECKPEHHSAGNLYMASLSLMKQLVEALETLLSHPSDECYDAVETANGLYFLTPFQIAERDAKRILKKLG